MKKNFLLPLCIVLLLIACRKSNSGTEQLVKVQEEECRSTTFSAEQVSLCFDSLIQDSRCPANAMCIWQGVAQARFIFKVNNRPYTFVLSTNKVLPGTRTDTTIQNYTVSLVDVKPYPGSGATITPYAEVRIKKQ